MDYTKFKVEEFAADDLFIKWVLENDPDADRFWLAYLEEHPEVRPAVNHARTLLVNLDRAKKSSHSQEQLQKMWDNIEAGVGWTNQEPRTFGVYRIAAAIAVDRNEWNH